VNTDRRCLAANGATVNDKAAGALVVAAAIAIASAGVAWFQASAHLRELRLGELESIAALLEEDQELLRALQTNFGSAKDSGILASYLAKIRADGVAKHAEMKQQLDRLAENNSAIVALINVYRPHAKTAAFSTEAEKFVSYAIAWRDRWNSMMELFMAGGNYPAAEVPFPKTFSSAVQTEIEAAQHVF
jgi:hypothetical protein